MSISLEMLGDRWSLLLIRDMMVRGCRTFREFQRAGEGIATNILADRLRKLAIGGIISTEPAADDGRSAHYRLTEKGIALAPVLLDLLIWGAQHEETAAPCSVIAHMEQNREALLAETRHRWAERDPTPLIPPFTGFPASSGDSSASTQSLKRKRSPKSRQASNPKSSPKGKLKR